MLGPSEYLAPCPAGAESLHLELPHLSLAALAWGDPTGQPLLALHGWLDNAMSFVRLGPVLAQAGYRVVAPDFAGHGHSDWRPAGQPYVLLQNCFDIQALAEHLGWSRFTLVGHSMGAGVASLLAGAHPQAIAQLVLLDGLGTLTTSEAEAPAQLGRALGRWLGHEHKQLAHQDASPSPRGIYPSIQAAAQARMQGVGVVDLDAALQLCQRGLRRVDDEHQAGGWFWRSDPRLRHPSPWRLTEAQNHAFIRAIQAPCLYVEADLGLLVERPEIQARFNCLSQGCKRVVAGGHHLHLEQRSAQAAAEAVLDFLRSLAE